METYRCFVRGENFRLEVDGKRDFYGFYTNRWLNAESPDHAEKAVVALLKQEPILQKPHWHDGSGPSAIVYVEEIELVEEADVGPNQGFSFFREDEQEPPSP